MGRNQYVWLLQQPVELDPLLFIIAVKFFIFKYIETGTEIVPCFNATY